jgi:hypothetical protein
VTYSRVLDWMIGFIDTLYIHLRNTGNNIANAYQHTSQSTVTHVLGFSGFTSRILATDLSQTQCNFKSHMKTFLHSLIPFLSLLCNWQLNSNPLLPSSYPGRLTSRNSTRLDYDFSNEFFFITSLYGPRRRHNLSIIVKACLQRSCTATEFTRLLPAYSLRVNVFTESLPNNDRLYWLYYSGLRASCHIM